MNLWPVLLAYALILAAQLLPIRWWWLSLLLFAVGLGLIFWSSCDVQTPVAYAAAALPPLSPPAVADWFRRATERARAVLAPGRAEAAARFLTQTETALREIGLWLDTGGNPSAEVVAAAQQAANAASGLAAKCRQKGASAKRASTPASGAARRPANAGDPAPLETFARDVLALAARVPPWGPGSAKRYISQVFRAWQENPANTDDLPSFKARLLQANQQGLLRLARADLPEVMDGKELRASHIQDGRADFHFLNLSLDAAERGKQPASSPGAPRPPANAGADEDLQTFARQVKEVALAAKEGTWLGHKVFIAQAWKDYTRLHPSPALSLERFKAHLVAAYRAGLVALGRADLVAVLPQDAVRLSRIDDGSRTFHFVETEHLRAADEAIALDAVQAEAANHKPGTLLVMADVRRRAPLSKERFDRAVLALSRVRRVTIHHHDHAHLVSDADREGMVHDAARDVYYVGIVAR